MACVKDGNSLMCHDMQCCCRCFFLQRPRLELFERIDLRVEQMVDGGLLQVEHSVSGLLPDRLLWQMHSPNTLG